MKTRHFLHIQGENAPRYRIELSDVEYKVIYKNGTSSYTTSMLEYSRIAYATSVRWVNNPTVIGTVIKEVRSCQAKRAIGR